MMNTFSIMEGSSMMGGYGMWFGPLFMLIFWAFIGYLLFSLIRYVFGKNDPRKEISALEILKKRYASGEIDIDQYTSMKATIK